MCRDTQDVQGRVCLWPSAVAYMEGLELTRGRWQEEVFRVGWQVAGQQGQQAASGGLHTTTAHQTHSCVQSVALNITDTYI